MAVAEMTCAECNAYLNLDLEDEEAVLDLALRFANKHVECGFMNPPAEPPAKPSGQTLRIRKLRTEPEPDEDEDDLDV